MPMAIKDFEYYVQLRTLLTHSLLHLFMQTAYSARRIPVKSRNELLVRYLKPKIKQSEYSMLKKDIRVLINIGRNAKGNLEKRMVELLSVAGKHQFNGVQRLYDLLVHLQENHGLVSHLFNPDTKAEPEILYVLEDHIEHCFENDEQVAPVSMLIQSNKAPNLVDIINQQRSFQAEMKEWNDVSKQAHLVLHPA